MYWVLPSFTGFYWVLLGFTGFYWVLPRIMGFYFAFWALTRKAVREWSRSELFRSNKREWGNPRRPSRVVGGGGGGVRAAHKEKRPSHQKPSGCLHGGVKIKTRSIETSSHPQPHATPRHPTLRFDRPAETRYTTEFRQVDQKGGRQNAKKKSRKNQ